MSGDWPKIEATAANEERAVLILCRNIGFGRVMQAAEKLWGQYAEGQGHPGSQHTVGPCAALLVPCVCTEPDTRNGSCDWCCGSQRLTKAVKALVQKTNPEER